jgi:CRP-like cAMP-binding protein
MLGDIFGELALQSKAPRSLTARALSNTSLIIIRATTFHKLSKRGSVGSSGNPAFEQRKLLLWQALAPSCGGDFGPNSATLFRLCYSFQETQVGRGVVLQRQGQPASKVWLVLSGELRVILHQGSNTASRETLGRGATEVACCGRGSLLGELLAEPRLGCCQTTVVAVSACQLLVAEHGDFFSKLGPSAADSIAKEYALRMDGWLRRAKHHHAGERPRSPVSPRVRSRPASATMPSARGSHPRAPSRPSSPCDARHAAGPGADGDDGYASGGYASGGDDCDADGPDWRPDSAGTSREKPVGADWRTGAWRYGIAPPRTGTFTDQNLWEHRGALAPDGPLRPQSALSPRAMRTVRAATQQWVCHGGEATGRVQSLLPESAWGLAAQPRTVEKGLIKHLLRRGELAHHAKASPPTDAAPTPGTAPAARRAPASPRSVQASARRSDTHRGPATPGQLLLGSKNMGAWRVGTPAEATQATRAPLIRVTTLGTPTPHAMVYGLPVQLGRRPQSARRAPPGRLA